MICRDGTTGARGVGLEIEAKLKVPDHEPIRLRLRGSGATLIGRYIESNTFFDTDGRSLVQSDQGLRLRTMRNIDTGQSTHTLTHKGPRQPGPLKTREETEIIVNDPTAATALLQRLGFAQTLAFQKRRESWRLGDCRIEVDELPHLGHFIEIEGPTPAAIEHARRTLNLHDHPLITESYIAMFSHWLDQHHDASRVIRFADDGYAA
jgi:adenylate cyclase, class 2